MHLGATYLKNPLEYEKRVVDWLMSVKDEAKAIYMLGDILDYWYEYRTVVPRGYVRFFGALATLADEGVKIYWFIGNHDIWLFDYGAVNVMSTLRLVSSSTSMRYIRPRLYMSTGISGSNTVLSSVTARSSIFSFSSGVIL